MLLAFNQKKSVFFLWCWCLSSYLFKTVKVVISYFVQGLITYILVLFFYKLALLDNSNLDRLASVYLNEALY